MLDFAQSVYAHTAHLAHDIGPRPLGSPGDHAAAQYCEDIFRDIGLQVTRQEYDCPAWECDGMLLKMDGQRLEAVANWYSMPCAVAGELVSINTLKALRDMNLTGKIVYLYGQLTRYEIAPRESYVWYPSDQRRLNELLDAKQPLAVIAESPFDSRHVFRDHRMPMPSATVPPDVGRVLRRSAGKAVRLTIDARRTQSRSCNLLGVYASGSSERIVICAHYDTVWNCPGAIDNASGVGVMLAAAQALVRVALPVDLEFVAFGAEEITGLGSLAYLEPYGLHDYPFRMDQPVQEQSEVWKPIRAVVNADGVGVRGAANNVAVVAASEAFSEMIARIHQESFPAIVQVPPWPASNHYTFYTHGVPSIALSFQQGDVPNVIHQSSDTLDHLDPAKLCEAARFVVRVVSDLSNKPSDWCRQQAP